MMQPAMKRRRRAAMRLAAAAVATALTTGCQARLFIDVDVGPDGAGELAVTVAADEALQERAEASGADPLGDLVATGAALRSEGWRTAERVEDGWRSVRLSARYRDPAAFNDLAAELAEALEAAEASLLEGLALDVGDGRIRLSGTAGLVPTGAVAELGLEPAAAQALLADSDAFLYDVRVHLPGEVLETTAAQGEQPLRWRVEPGRRVQIVAVSEQPSDSAWSGLGVVGGLVAAAAGSLLWWRRRPRP